MQPIAAVVVELHRVPLPGRLVEQDVVCGKLYPCPRLNLPTLQVQNGLGAAVPAVLGAPSRVDEALCFQHRSHPRQPLAIEFVRVGLWIEGERHPCTSSRLMMLFPCCPGVYEALTSRCSFMALTARSPRVWEKVPYFVPSGSSAMTWYSVQGLPLVSPVLVTTSLTQKVQVWGSPPLALFLWGSVIGGLSTPRLWYLILLFTIS